MAAETKIVFIGMNNQRTPPEITGSDTLQEIAIRFICEFNISEIAGVTLMATGTIRPMIRGWPDVPMRTGTKTSFATEISRYVNMESMFAWWQLRKGRHELYSILNIGSDRVPYHCIGGEYGDSHLITGV